MKQTKQITASFLQSKRHSTPAAGDVTLYELTIYNGDFSKVRIFTTIKAALDEWNELQTSGEDFTDAALCELILKGSEFVNNSFSLI